jgi:hypothetical protein
MSRPYLTSHYYTSIAKNGGPQQNKMQIRKEFDPVKKENLTYQRILGYTPQAKFMINICMA